MGVDARPVPAPDETTAFYWEGAAAGKLLVQKCAACGRMQYPPDVVCTWCQALDLEVVESSGRGKLYSFAVVDRPFHPAFVDAIPYVVGLVDLDDQDGLRLLTNIVGGEPMDLVVGAAVEVVFEQRGQVTLPQFRPTEAPR